jgi:putative FmdB family regulatory protein
MPQYDFQCNACNVVQELILSVNESGTVPKCSLCEGVMRRVFTPPAVHFRGPGFYKTGG